MQVTTPNIATTQTRRLLMYSVYVRACARVSVCVNCWLLTMSLLRLIGSPENVYK